MIDVPLRRIEPTAAYDALLRMLEDENMHIRDVCSVVHTLPTLAARVLSLANSERYAGSTPVDRIDRAVILLDRDGVADLAAQARDEEPFTNAVSDLDGVELQRHHIVSAEAAALLAEAARIPLVEEARTAALLHDCGMQLQQEINPRGFAEAWIASHVSGARLVDHERLCTGTDHCELAQRWLSERGIPRTTVNAIEFHHDPLSAPRRVRYLAVLLFAAECLVARAGFGRHSGGSAPTLEERILEELRFSEEILEAHVPAFIGRIIDVTALAPAALGRGAS